MALTGPTGFESPSAAFLAGQQHGTQLAVKHAMPAATKTRTASPTRRPASSPTSTTTGDPTLNDILAQAKALAASDTSAQVGAYKAQQNTYAQQAKDRAAQINLASQAASKFLTGIGDNTASSYNDAAKVLAGIAGGYSGDLKNTATDAASQVRAQLANLGAPAGSLKTPTGQTPQPEALSNVLYGLGGAIPANLLVNSGQAQAAAQRTLPASTLGFGQQQALGTIAAGQQQADALNPQILAAQAGQPKLTQQYLAQIQSQLMNAALAQSLIANRDTTATIAQQNADTAAANSANSYALGSQRNTIAQQNADARAAAAKKGKPLTAPQRQKTTALAYGIANNGLSGKDGKGNPAPVLSYTDAVNEMRKQGLFADPRTAQLALKALNDTYKSNAPATTAIDFLTSKGVKPNGPPLTKKQSKIANQLFPLVPGLGG
jgi:hypothetical protein